jgi:hypothetical protein
MDHEILFVESAALIVSSHGDERTRSPQPDFFGRQRSVEEGHFIHKSGESSIAPDEWCRAPIKTGRVFPTNDPVRGPLSMSSSPSMKSLSVPLLVFHVMARW